MAGGHAQHDAALLGVKRRAINQNLPTISFGHRMKYLAAFQSAPQVKIRRGKLHKLVARLHRMK
jgi:hypothetical protein